MNVQSSSVLFIKQRTIGRGTLPVCTTSKASITAATAGAPRSNLLHLPQSERTVANVVRLAAVAFADRPFVQYRDSVVSYEDAYQRSIRLAKGLTALGVGEGARVAILAGNCLEYLDLWFALAKLRAVQLPVNTAYKAQQILHTLNRAPVPVVVIDPEIAGEFAQIADQLSACRHVVWLGEPPMLTPGHATHHRYEDLLSAKADCPHARDVRPGVADASPSDVVAIMNTSGTTGPSKGVLLPHGQQYALGKIIADALKLSSDDVYYNFFPLFHNTAQAMIALPTMLVGARMVLTDKFSLSAFYPDVRRHGVTVFYFIGEILHLLVRSAEDQILPTLRAAWGIGGAPADCAAFERKFGVRLGTGYGSTEANVPVIRPLGADPLSKSAGRVSDLFEVRVCEPGGAALPFNQVGEICVRAADPDILMRGYDADPAATVEALRDGWVRTGDAGRFDADGNFYFEARLKDVIRVRGENVSSFEVEQAVLQLPGVLEAAAIAVPADIGGDDIKIVIVTQSGAVLEPQVIIAHCERLLPKFAVPRYVAFKDGLPRTETNKIKKNVLREDGIGVDVWDRTVGTFLS
jgi:crotonobetaine/carnitine-CoA ligase